MREELFPDNLKHKLQRNDKTQDFDEREGEQDKAGEEEPDIVGDIQATNEGDRLPKGGWGHDQGM